MADNFIFEEDEISLSLQDGKTQKYGLVLESSEYASTDEEEDEQDLPNLKKGTVRVAWHPSGEEEIIEEKMVKLLDRSLMPGDVVRRMIEGQDSQRGYVRTTNVNCHLQVLGQLCVIPNVSSTLVQPIVYWDPEPGDVTIDSWVGKIEYTNEQVVVLFSDGACCVVDDDEHPNDLYTFEDLNDKREKDSEFYMKDYYPGQRFRGQLGSFTQAKWLKTTSSHSPSAAKKHPDKVVIITVEKVEPKSIDVNWLCKGYAQVENSLDQASPPPNSLGPDDIKRLKKLDCFGACSVQIGDKATYTIQENDLILQVDSDPWQPLLKSVEERLQRIVASSAENLHEKQRFSKHSDGLSDVFDDYSQPIEQTNVNVKEINSPEKNDETDEYTSDDGSVTSSHSADSNSSSKSKRTKKGAGLKTRLLKKKKYKRSRKQVNKPGETFHKPGDTVIVEIIYTFSTIEVMWQNGTIQKNIPSTELYPIHYLDELEFFPGDFIIRNTELASIESSYGVIEKVDHSGRCCIVHWLKPYQVGQRNKPQDSTTEEVSVYDIKDHPDYKFRPGHVVVRVGGYQDLHSQAAGQVYELMQDGRIHIKWSNNMLSYCYPQELYLIGEELSDLESLDLSSTDDEEDDSDASDSDSQGSWETEDEQEHIGLDDKQSDGTDELTVEVEKKIELDQLLEIARSTLQKLEDTFSQNMEINPYAVHCYKEIIHIYHNCKELDTMLRATYFEDVKLVENIGIIKKELKKERSAKMTKQVQELFECNVRLAKENGMTDQEQFENSTCDKINPKDSESCLVTRNSQLTNSDVLTSFVGEHNSIKSNRCLSDEVLTDIDCNKNSAENKDKTSSDVSEENMPKEKSVLLPSGTKQSAKDLCEFTCRLLKEQIMKVHKDLENQWQLLKATGVVIDKNAKSEAKDSVIEDKESENGSPESLMNDQRRNLSLNLQSPTDSNLPEPLSPQTPAEIREKILYNKDGFQLMERCPLSHKYYSNEYQPSDLKSFLQTVKKELQMLSSALPIGIYVKGFEDRMDLFSVMILGPERTPYEDGLFFFDVKLSNDYPNTPPSVHYISYCCDRLNPNLYEDGKVCVSLLGTWSGRGTEVWTSKSSLLQLLISIQGLILVSEPYYNEAGYEKQKGTQQGKENSRMYNEMAILKMVQSMTKMVKSPIAVFETEIVEHMKKVGFRMVHRLKVWIDLSTESVTKHSCDNRPPGQIPSDQNSELLDTYETSANEENQKSAFDNKNITHYDKCEEMKVSSKSHHEQLTSDSTNSHFSLVLKSPSTVEDKAEFPLLPCSRGFSLSLAKYIANFKDVLASI